MAFLYFFKQKIKFLSEIEKPCWGKFSEAQLATRPPLN